MKICTLASGSKGNSTYIEAGGVRILIDAGLAFAEIARRLRTLGEDIYNINAVLITHEHADHIKSVDVMLECGIEVYCHAMAYNAMRKKFPIGMLKTFTDHGFNLGGVEIYPFRVPHDAAYSVGYRLTHGGEAAAFATDLGHITDGIVNNMRGSAYILAESNHDVTMLRRGKYPHMLKQRIEGMKGHLSNDTCAALLSRVITKDTRFVRLAHLSEENNFPELAFHTVTDKLREMNIVENGRLSIEVAAQHFIGEPITL
jgi:phosphoribosyl 1,2-cyclic phosphodiesterase